VSRLLRRSLDMVAAAAESETGATEPEADAP